MQGVTKEKIYCKIRFLLLNANRLFIIINMKALFLVFLVACGGWSKTDTLRELSFAGVTTADWIQTRQITSDCTEMNPIIGQCGHGPIGVNTEMPLAIIGHAIISAALPGKYRHAWQYLTIGGEILAVTNNLNHGYDFTSRPLDTGNISSSSLKTPVPASR